MFKHTLKIALQKAILKALGVLTSRKALVLTLSTWLLINDYLSSEIFAAIALAFMSVVGYTGHVERLASMNKPNRPIKEPIP